MWLKPRRADACIATQQKNRIPQAAEAAATEAVEEPLSSIQRSAARAAAKNKNVFIADICDAKTVKFTAGDDVDRCTLRRSVFNNVTKKLAESTGKVDPRPVLCIHRHCKCLPVDLYSTQPP